MEQIQKLKTGSRNLSLECCKLVAACFVVFLHVPFPGLAGKIVNCLARFAVPLFFAVSGWYSFGASSRKLAERLKHILLLALAGDALYIGSRCLVELYYGETLVQSLLRRIPDLQAVKLWMLWNVDPFAGHLWYLWATVLCYLVLWIRQRVTGEGKRYGVLYLTGAGLLTACFAMSEFSRFTGITVDYRVYRSGLFLGMPVFFLGMFLRQHRRWLSRRAGFLLAGGIVLSFLEREVFGSWDVYLGSVLTAASLLLLTDTHPRVPRWLEKPAARFGRVSTGVYLTHLLWNDLYQTFFSQTGAGSLMPWLYPPVILLVSVAAALLWDRVRTRENR